MAATEDWNGTPTSPFGNELVAICKGVPDEAELTVRMAVVLLALPAELLTTTVNCARLSDIVSTGVV